MFLKLFESNQIKLIGSNWVLNQNTFESTKSIFWIKLSFESKQFWIKSDQFLDKIEFWINLKLFEPKHFFLFKLTFEYNHIWDQIEFWIKWTDFFGNFWITVWSLKKIDQFVHNRLYFCIDFPFSLLFFCSWRRRQTLCLAAKN